MNLPADYEERVYAGVLGKMIGVYLGRPFEGWTNKKIEDELGEVWYYVHEKRGVPLIVTDDDLSGTFGFIRAFSDNGNPYEVTEEQVGQTWLNYLIENKTVLWWGGMGNSTEHTAYLRLQAGYRPPQSGSAELNGTVVAEQIGAQIFIDGWAMLCPGDPELAATLARKAACVSHDGEAIYGAQVIAALEALAFVETNRDRMLDQAVTFIPRGSLIYAMIADIRQWHAAEPNDWRATLRKIEDKYGYDKYGGNCHMVPNHAVIILALLYGDDDFQKSLMIANTAGWDTDCNSGNVGCLMGLKLGLAGIDRGPDWRGPVADRLYIPTADGGRAITDAARETYHIVNIARQSRGMRPVAPNNGMRCHFALPGSYHGFVAENSPESSGTVTRIENVVLGHLAENAGVAADERALAIGYHGVAPGRTARVGTATFIPPDALKSGGYGLLAAPTLYPGQVVRARVVADDANERDALSRIYLRVYGKDDTLETLRGPAVLLAPGDFANLIFEVPDTGGRPIAEVGVKVSGASGSGVLYLDWLGWSGTPTLTFTQPEDAGRGSAWRRMWVDAVDRFDAWRHGDGKIYRMIQDRGVGLALSGGSDWQDYTVSCAVQAHLADRIGIVACARGLRRNVSLTVASDGLARLTLHRDDREYVLAEEKVAWHLDKDYLLSITTHSDGRLRAVVDDGTVTEFLEGEIGPDQSIGGIGLLTQVGHGHFGPVSVEPAP